jgi:mono/diheme cytochrome c family protein
MQQRIGEQRTWQRARRALKFVGMFLGGLLSVTTMVAFMRAEHRLSQRYRPELSPVQASAEARERGEHLSHTYGCRHCHGEDLGGRVMEEGPLMTLNAPNLTPASPVTADFRAEDWARAILHGVARDGRPLLIMPAQHLRVLSDEDVAALASYLPTTPAVQRTLPPARLTILGRMLLGFGADLLPAEHIEHTRPRAQVIAEPLAANVAHGTYLARACAGCHGADFRGGPPHGPPGTPAPPSIAPDVLASWTKPQFLRAIREGKKRDGSELDPMMPWQSLRHMSDDELTALWLALRAGVPRVQ